MSIVILILAAVFGLFLPGWLLCRRWACGATVPAAVIVSVVLLYQAVFYLQLLSISIGLVSVGVLLMVWCLATATAGRWLTPSPTTDPSEQGGGADAADADAEAAVESPPDGKGVVEAPPADITPAGRWTKAQVALAGVCVVLFAVLMVRIWALPLSGDDTVFRWERLAVALYDHGHIDYYPPTEPDHYRVYFFPDAIPPLVQFAYYWLYEGLGETRQEATSLFVGLQLLCLGLLTYAIARLDTDSRTAGLLAVVLLASSQLFVWASAMGQETGATALAFAGVYYFLRWGRASGQRTRAVVLAAFAAAMGALAREYGWIMLVIALPVGWLEGYRLRDLSILTSLTLAMALPWYLRNWVLTGNPVYPIVVGSLFDTNPIYYQTTAFAREAGPRTAQEITGAMWFAVERSGLLLLVGVIAMAALCRRRAWWSLFVAMALMTVIWLMSVPHTYFIGYSLRVMSPVLLALAVLAAAALWAHRQRLGVALKPVAAVLALVAAGLGVLNVSLFPVSPFAVSPRHWSQFAAIPDVPDPTLKDVPPVMLQMGQAMREVGIDTRGRVLVGDLYMHAALSPFGYDPVPAWSPEVEFIIDPSLPADEITRRLRGANIRYVLINENNRLEWYLREQPLYRQASSWKEVLRLDAMRLYELPKLSRAQ